MRILLLLLALFSLPALAADYSPWLDDDDGPSVCQAQSSPSSPQQEDKQSPEKKAYPGRYCCVHCRHNEAPCGGKCVAPPAAGKKAFCKGPPGCACPGKP
jgi:hypothetical protein